MLVGDFAPITKVYCPRLAAPAGALLPPVVDLGVFLLLVGLPILHDGAAPTWRVLAVPMSLLLPVLTAFSVSCGCRRSTSGTATSSTPSSRCCNCGCS